MPGSRATDRSPALGQHFLASRRLAAQLVADSGAASGDRVVDLGAGSGILTAALAATGATVLAVEIDDALTTGLARRFWASANVTVLRADARAVALPVNPYRVVANPPFAHTAAILHRLLDDPGGGLQRVDLVVQWQVARHRAKVSAGGPTDLVGATWAPWWRFARARRLPAACFRPRPSVDAAVLVITRADPPGLPPEEFGRYEAFLRANWGKGPTATDASDWPSRYRRRAGRPPHEPGLHSRVESANMG